MNTIFAQMKTRVLLFLAWIAALPTAADPVEFLAFGDWGYGRASSHQRAVAARLERYTRKHVVSLDAVLLLGDNFYRPLKGTDDRRWRTLFEDMYDDDVFRVPFYVALGNHDYESKQRAAQFAYMRQNPDGRWKLPAKWYAVDFPPKEPLVTVLVLDSNWSRQTPEERESQNLWLNQQLSESRNAPWTIVAAHHPLFSNGRHGDTPVLIEDWGRLLRRHKVDFYLSGHDHNLQHLEIQEWPTSFVVSGGGGAKLQQMRRDDRGPFSRGLHGFVHLKLTPQRAVVRYIGLDGDVIHEFTRAPAGDVTVLATTGRDKPRPKKQGEDDEED